LQGFRAYTEELRGKVYFLQKINTERKLQKVNVRLITTVRTVHPLFRGAEGTGLFASKVNDKK
jgi:hypothetical protein